MIAIIMSTYNGGDYIAAQIESLLNQTVRDFVLLIRDDGSTDDTPEKIASYHDERIVFWRGDNLGPANSFFELLREAKRRSAEYVFFCDQDDVWMADKLEIFLAAFDRQDTKPQLVFSDFAMIDGEGVQTEGSYAAHAGLRIPEDGDFLPKLLAQPYVFGCASAINAPLLSLVQDAPEGIEMYDCWIALTACVMGVVRYLPCATIEHRFHTHNATGRLGQDSITARLRRLTTGIKKQCANTKLRLNQPKLLLQQFGETMPAPVVTRLKRMKRSVERGGFVCAGALRREGVCRGGALQNIFFYLTILLQKGE